MATDLEDEQAALQIHILGVNDIGLESGNGGMVEGQHLPWLQPPADQDIWNLWPVEYRDVLIVGPGNELLDVYNLTQNDLSVTENYDALRRMLLEAADE